MRRWLLVWLCRKPCGCTHHPRDAYVLSFCWRHALVDWLGRHYVLVTDEGGYYRDGYLELRPWRWNVEGYLRTAREQGLLAHGWLPPEQWGAE